MEKDTKEFCFYLSLILIALAVLTFSGCDTANRYNCGRALTMDCN